MLRVIEIPILLATAATAQEITDIPECARVFAITSNNRTNMFMSWPGMSVFVNATSSVYWTSYAAFGLPSLHIPRGVRAYAAVAGINSYWWCDVPE